MQVTAAVKELSTCSNAYKSISVEGWMKKTAVISAKQNISTIKGMQPIMLQSEPAFTNFNLCF